MEKLNERQKNPDLYKELMMSAYNLKSINEDQSNLQDNTNVIRKDFPSDYTKSNIAPLSNVFLDNQQVNVDKSVRNQQVGISRKIS